MKSAVVTGGTGFIGKRLVSELLENGVHVTLVLLPEITDMQALPASEHLHIVDCGLKDIGKLPERIKNRGFDVFFHLAWNGSAGELRGNVEEQLNNAAYSCYAVRAAKSLGCRKFVGAGSIMEDEANLYIPQKDADPSINYIYSCAKLTAHYMCKTIANREGIEFCWGKISNAYGEGDLTGRFVHSTVKNMLKGVKCSFTHGKQLYDFIYVGEVAKAFIAIGEKGRAGRSYYIGTFDVKPLSEFIHIMKSVLKSSSEIEMGAVPFKGALLPREYFDAEPLYSDTGFKATIPFEEGLLKYKDWLEKTNGI
jgi:UDP-glucose 4-epimerase